MNPAAREFFAGQPPFQMYVQYWPPAGGPRRSSPLVLVHGAAHTGVVWTATPDGRPGWAPYFTSEGWPVYAVDWPGVGRSGFPPDFLNMGSKPVVDALADLLEREGPASVLGHSMGAPLTMLLAERLPDRVRAMILVTPSSPANTAPVRPPAPLDAPIRFDRQQVRARFANSRLFPQHAFEQYFSSLVPLSPSIANAAYHQNEDWRIERPEMVRDRPVLFLASEEDQTVTHERSEPAAEFLQVNHTLLGADWGLPGHAHMVMLEAGHLDVARHIGQWLAAAV